MKQIGQGIADARREKGYKQDEFADLIGVSHGTLSRLEQGSNTSTATMMRALQFLGLRFTAVPKGAIVEVHGEEKHG